MNLYIISDKPFHNLATYKIIITIIEFTKSGMFSFEYLATHKCRPMVLSAFVQVTHFSTTA